MLCYFIYIDMESTLFLSLGEDINSLLLIMVNHWGYFCLQFYNSLVLPQSAEFFNFRASASKVCQLPVSALNQVKQKAVPLKSGTLNTHSTILFLPKGEATAGLLFPLQTVLAWGSIAGIKWSLIVSLWLFLDLNLPSIHFFLTDFEFLHSFWGCMLLSWCFCGATRFWGFLYRHFADGYWASWVTLFSQYL